MAARRDLEEKILAEIKTLLEDKDREAGRIERSLKTAKTRVITRDADHYITQIVISDGTTTKTITVHRTDHYIDNMSDVVS